MFFFACCFDWTLNRKDREEIILCGLCGSAVSAWRRKSHRIASIVDHHRIIIETSCSGAVVAL
jgi:hypothetical protein